MQPSTYYSNEQPMVRFDYDDGTYHVMTWVQWKEIVAFFERFEPKEKPMTIEIEPEPKIEAKMKTESEICPLYTTICEHTCKHTNKIIDISTIELIAEHYNDSERYWCYMKLYYSDKLHKFIEVQFSKDTNKAKQALIMENKKVIPIIVYHCNVDVIKRFNNILGIEDLS
jgi:hypothetical protein